MKQVPMCNKCANAVTEENDDGSALVFIGCKASEHIHNYFDAKGNCPLLKIEKFDVTEFISATKNMTVDAALEAIFVATTKKQLSFTVFRTMIGRLAQRLDNSLSKG